MAASPLSFKNWTAYFRKAISNADFGSESVLTRDTFDFVDLWLQKNHRKAIAYWTQAKSFALAARELPSISAPLPAYYCFLNAAKTLLSVKGENWSDRHGVSGSWDPTSKRVIANEDIGVKGAGVLSSLSNYLGETAEPTDFTLEDALANLPYIHRAYHHTFAGRRDIFFPLTKPMYRKHPTLPRIWFSAELKGKMADERVLRSLPDGFERDSGFNNCTIRAKQRVRWFKPRDSREDKDRALARLKTYHRKIRRKVVYISAQPDLWYLKREVSGTNTIYRSNLTLAMAAMHRLSEISRYDPQGLSQYLTSKYNWLLSEFIKLSVPQFLDEIACEITGLEMRIPGIRPN